MSFQLASRDSPQDRKWPSPGSEIGLGAMVGQSPNFKEAVGLARKVAERKLTTVLLTGETGTGKELFARGIHYSGPSRGEAFVALNCPAIPPALLESELFGHEKGAFTDARSRKQGLLELAGEGTLFLDEIIELPPDLQPKLLRALEERRVRRLGGLQEIEVRCRIMAASNESLENAVSEGRFRPDLFYRLNVFRIRIPPLRQRAEDIRLLAKHFLEILTQEQGLATAELTPGAMAALERDPGPGNVRQMKNVIEQAAILAEGGKIMEEHLQLQRPRDLLPATAEERGVGRILIPPEGKRMEDIEAEALRITLDLTGGNQSATARILGLSRPTVIRKMKLLGISSGPREGEEMMGLTAERSGVQKVLDDHLQTARSAERTGAWVEARNEYEAALGLLFQANESALASPLLRWIGRTHLNAGALQEAEDCFEAALAVAELTEDQESRSNTLNCIAIVQQQRGKLDEAEELYNKASVWAEAGSDRKLQAMIDQNLGTIACIRGHPALAVRHYRKSLERYRDLGLSDYVAPLLSNMAMLLGKMGDFDEAEELYGEAFAAAEDRGDVNTQVAIQVNRAALWIDSGNHGEAQAACEAAYGPAERLGVPRWLGEIHKILGVIHRDGGDLAKAEENLGKAEDFARETEDTLLVAEILKELAEVYWLGGRHRDTLGCLSRAHDLFSELEARHDLADLAEKLERLEELFQEIVVRWGESIESSDLYTHGHCERVAQFGCALAEAVGMASGDLTWFKMGAFLHDLGKVLLPPDILNKPGPLNGEERAIMETHPAQGEKLLEEIDFPWDIRPMVRHHHEHWAGTGYPDGLSGTEIPLSARVLTIADVFDALTTERSYRPAFSLEKALEIMEEDSGRIFDPYLFSIFSQLVVGAGPEDHPGSGHPSALSPPERSWVSDPGGWTRKARRPRQHSWTSEYPEGLFGQKPGRLSEMH